MKLRKVSDKTSLKAHKEEVDESIRYNSNQCDGWGKHRISAWPEGWVEILVVKSFYSNI